MKKTLSILFLVFSIISVTSQAQNISTIAGSGLSTGPLGDGAAATAVSIRPGSVNFDRHGNMYITEPANHRIRKVSPSGIITTFAGSGSGSYSGEGGSATAAVLPQPCAVAFDKKGNTYIADNYACRLFKVDSAGIIKTIAGNGIIATSGDGGSATAASLRDPNDIKLDSAGNIYIADLNGFCIRKISTSGIITTIAGNGSSAFSGDGGPATAAGVTPDNLLIDRAGNILISDVAHHLIRKIGITGIISTIAGGGSSSGDGVLATNELLCMPTGLVLDPAGKVIFSDHGHDRLCKIDSAGIITTIAGNGGVGFGGDGGLAIHAEFDGPGILAFDAIGNLAIVDLNNNRVRKITFVEAPVTPAAIGNGNTLQPQSIFPNPAKDMLYVNDITYAAHYNLVDINGKSVSQGVLKPGNNTIPVSMLCQGIYFLHLCAEDGTSNIFNVVKQ